MVSGEALDVTWHGHGVWSSQGAYKGGIADVERGADMSGSWLNPVLGADGWRECFKRDPDESASGARGVSVDVATVADEGLFLADEMFLQEMRMGWGTVQRENQSLLFVRRG